MPAITRTPSPQMDRCNLTYVQRHPIDGELALRQHAAFCQTLKSLGCDVLTLAAEAELPDCAFVEDTAVILDDVAVLTRPHASRQPELPTIAAALQNHCTLVSIEPQARIEGGDVLRIGNTILVGQSTRTDSRGLEQLNAIAQPRGFHVRSIKVRGCLHLKTACTAIDPQTLLVNPAWVDRESLTGFELISVPDDEPYAANTLRIRDTILVPSSMIQTSRMLQDLGYVVRTVDISEFSKAEAGLTCLALLVP